MVSSLPSEADSCGGGVRWVAVSVQKIINNKHQIAINQRIELLVFPMGEKGGRKENSTLRKTEI